MTLSGRFGSGAVASPHHRATEVGRDVLAAGGNAVDAAVAVNLALGVLAPYACGYGGDLFAIVWDGSAHGYEGAGRAPAGADPVLGKEGAHAVTVPGAIRGWFDLLGRFGTLSFADLARPAIALARDGFAPSEHAAAAIAASSERFGGGPEWMRVYGAARAGERLVQADLGRTIEALCSGGPGTYYRGPIAEAIVAELRARGGVHTLDDLAAHAGEWVEPLSAPYRDVDVLELPPPTQGVSALEALRILDGVRPTGAAERHHMMIEACKLALADRDAAVGDPSSMRLDARALLTDDRIAGRRALIDPSRARAPAGAGRGGGDTAFMCAADAAGMLVGLIQSNWRGSGITVPGWGINLHNRGDFFSLDAGHPNAVGPRKRPLHTLIPAMALRRGEPWLVFGTMGGNGQAQTHVQLLARMVDDGLGPADAIAAPRWFADHASGALWLEDRFEAEVLDGLRARGHDVRVAGPSDGLMGHANAIAVHADGYEAASDPRTEGAALGV